MTRTTTLSPPTETFSLTPPAPVPAVSLDKTAGLVPVDDSKKSELERKVAEFVDRLVATPTNSPDFGKQTDSIANMGQKQVVEAASASNRFLERPIKAMDSEGGVGADLVKLRNVVEGLDPGKRGNLLSPRRILGIIPFGSKLQAYFDEYTPAQKHISAILQSMMTGKDNLLKDNAAIDGERSRLWNVMGQLEQMIYLAKALDKKLEDTAANLDATDPTKAKAIRETALFQVRQRTTDLLTQMAVSVQGYLALDLVKKNNIELIKGVDRASTTTVAALRTAVTVAQALTNQKLVMEQIGALNSTTANVIESTGRLLVDNTAKIHEQATNPAVPLETLKRAFENIYATMDAVDAYKLKALDSMKQTVDVLSGEVEKSQAYIARAQGADQNAGSPLQLS
ncbi:toxic anion resistance protein [Sphingomonas sp. 3-13AW]|uniref:toxic anion resistance protein n=1 Tax=Sphingomonas sp. 3-13AW TaxID=3050450 RepID=UPI003BB7B94D